MNIIRSFMPILTENAVPMNGHTVSFWVWICVVMLDVKAKIPGGDVYEFQTAVGRAKEGCPVSRLLNAEITVDAQLVS